VLSFSIEAQALTTAKVGINVLPEPLPESTGQLIYEEMGCPICHGHQGGGDGLMADGLKPKPRNFTDFKVMSRLSDMTMFESIKNGVPDSAMPSWDLTDEQIFDVISYIKTFLADSQITVNICLNEPRAIDIRNLDIYKNYQISIDQKHFLKVVSKDNMVVIEPQGMSLLRDFKKTGRKLNRVHVMLSSEGRNGNIALIVARIIDCLK
jgi:hypothetical protein